MKGCTVRKFVIITVLLAAFIFVAESKAATVAGPIFDVPAKKIDLGVISVDEDIVVGEIDVFNTGSEDLEILKVSGSCSCFMGYTGNKLIKPGEGGVIKVQYDKKEIPAGRVTRTAKIETNDPANKVVKVYFSFTVERDAASEEMRALRSEIAGLRKEVHLLRSSMKTLVAALEKNNKAVATAAKPAAKPAAKCAAASPCGKKQQAAEPKPKGDTTVYDVTIGSSPTLGAKDAPVTITEFVDLQCPYCIREYPKIKDVLKAYPDKVRVVFKHKPLGFHKKAKPVHAAIELALRQKGNEAFWKMHDMIMAAPKKLDIPDLRGYAEELGLDMKNFDETMADSDQIDKLLATDKAEASKCGVRGTPTIMINGLKLANRSMDGYKARIDEILSKPAKAVSKK